MLTASARSRRRAAQTLAWLAWLVLPLATAASVAVPVASADEPILRDHYAAGAAVELDRPVLGDLGVAGGEVTVNERVAADLFAAGGWVTLHGPVADDLRAAGGRIEVRNRIGDHAALAGGLVEIGPDADIGGRAWMAGDSVVIAGRMRGPLEIAGDTVTLSGRFDGPVRVAARELRIRPEAHVAGDLVYRAPEAATVAPGARIDGELVFHRTPESRSPVRHVSLLTLAGFVLALLVVAAVLRFVCPRPLERSHDFLRREPLLGLGIGALILLVGPLLAIGLLPFVITIPLALAGLLLLPPLALVGYLVSAGTLTRIGLDRFAPQAGTTVVRQLAALAGVLLALGLLHAVPVLGALLAIAAVLFGSGALAIALWRGPRTATR